MFEVLGLLLLLAVVVAVHRGQPEHRHRRTDPACRHYSDAGRLRRWLNNRARGKSCPVCVRTYSPSRGWIAIFEAVDVPGRIAAGMTNAPARGAALWHCWTCDDCRDESHLGREKRTECRICGKTGPDCWH